MHKHRWAVFAAAFVVAGMAVAAAMAGPSRSTAGKTFYFIPKDTLNPYEVIADRGGKLALTELGDKQVVQSGTEDTAAAQQPAVQAAIQAHAAGIVIAGNDPDALCPALKQAQAAGTHVIAFDSDVSCRELFINQADTETIGRSQIALLGEADGLQGRVRHPVRGVHRDESERLDQVHEAGDEEAALQGHEARQDLLRQRQPGAVAAGNRRDAPGVPEPEGNRVADDRRDLVGRAVPVDLEEVQEQDRAHGPRPAEPDEEVRPRRHREGVRAVEPRGSRLPRGLRGLGVRGREDHRQGRPDVQGRQARDVQDHPRPRQAAAGDPRPAVRVRPSRTSTSSSSRSKERGRRHTRRPLLTGS